MKIREIVAALEEFAPLSLQDSYDNAGLQIGLTEDVEATGALLCLDVTEEVIDEAIDHGCNMVVSHHPLLFRPCKTITGKDYIERCVIKAIKHDVAIYSAHTNLDSAPGGVNWKIAEKLGLSNCRWLKPKPNTTHVLEGNPYNADSQMGAGEGIIGELPEVMEKEDFIALVKETFDAGSVRYNSWTGEQVKTVALCGGAGAFLMADAVKGGADAFITGEIGYHRFFGYEQDIMLMEIGHNESEQYTVEVLRDVIANKAPQLPIVISETETNPINYL